MMKKTRGRVFAAISFALAVMVTLPSSAQDSSVLRVARGQSSNSITVPINQATVLESGVEFAEISIANPAIADVQPVSNGTIYIFGQSRGTTSLTLFDKNGRLITNVLVNVQPNVSELKERLRQLLPGEPIEVRTAADGVILSGTVSGAAKVEKAMSLANAYAGDGAINMLSVGGTQQVMLKVKVAEISRNAGKELGIGLGLRRSGKDFNPRVDTGSRASTLPSIFSGSFGAIFNIADSLVLDVQLDALESKGFARTLSEPNLVSLSGVEASFLAGGEVPVPMMSSEGEVTVSFKPMGVNLNFLPLVLDNDLISVSVSAEVSQVDPSLTTTGAGGISVYGFQTRRATTTVELRDGQAFAIAGLLQENFEDTVQQVPWLGDIPVLGTLFRSVDFQRGQTELVIFVSVHMATPAVSARNISLPTDKVLLPSEEELFLFGKLTGSEAPLVGQKAGFDGDYGYVIE